MAGPRFWIAKLAAGLSLAATAVPVHAQPAEEAVKAAFIPKFARYVEWPPAKRPAPGEAYQLCVIGESPLGRLIDQAAASETIDGRRVVVRRLASAQEAAGCHLAFVQGSAGLSTARLLDALKRQPVLTVTDARAGPQRGMIHFTVQEGRVRFYIDEAAAKERGISISSRLLALAVSVRQRRS